MRDRGSGGSRLAGRGCRSAFLFQALSCVLLCGTAACGRAPRVVLPSGTGTPFPDFASAYADATRDCGASKSLSASINLSGHAAGTKISARIDAGFAAPAAIRLEGYPRINFGGKPFFILVSDAADTTLLMPRDGRVLRGAAPGAIVEALAGVALGPADLRSIVAGCGLESAAPSSARVFPNGWASLDAGETSTFLHQATGRWRVAGATRGALSVTYGDFADPHPATVFVRTGSGTGSGAADLTLRLSDVETNPALDPRVFEVDVPGDAAPITLDELRRAGPLGATDSKTEAAEGAEKFHHGGTEARSHAEAPLKLSAPDRTSPSSTTASEAGRARAARVGSCVTTETRAADSDQSCSYFRRLAGSHVSAEGRRATRLRASPCLRASAVEFDRDLCDLLVRRASRPVKAA
jgi:hypothetical protein